MSDKEKWIDWHGGECPVEEGTLIDVRYRGGRESIEIPALRIINTGLLSAIEWRHLNHDADIVAYRLHQVSTNGIADAAAPEKQERYQDLNGDDWIDECARTMTPEEFRGAMRFTVGKYIRRLGRKDAEIKEVAKMEDYCRRWRMHLEKMESDNESE